MSLVSVHVFHKRTICIEIFNVSSVQGTSRGDALIACVVVAQYIQGTKENGVPLVVFWRSTGIKHGFKN